MSGLPELCGHDDLRERFRAAAGLGRVPQSLLLHGPDGTGKQRLALWVGALILCQAEPAERPCGECPACRMAGGLQHPDLHWFFPLARPKGSHSPTKLRQLLEDARAEAIEARRGEAFFLPDEDSSAAIYLAAVDEIRERATRRPAMGRSSVFVIGDADRLVPQASSQEAANALLKLLEEPPTDTLLILTSSRPGALLPTIRSRVLSVRVTPADPDEAATFLERAAGLPAATAREVSRRAQGAVGAALRLAETEATEVDDAWQFVRCAATGRAADRYAMAAAFPPRGARGPFTDALNRIDEVLRECLTLAVGSVASAWHDGPDDRAGGLAEVSPDRLISCMDHVEQARQAAAGNGNPQVIAAVLLGELARELRHERGSGRNAAVGNV